MKEEDKKNKDTTGKDDVFGEREKKRLEFIKEELERLKKEADGLDAKKNKAKRKEDDHEKFLIGAAILADINHAKNQNEGAGQKQKAAIVALLNRAIVTKKDRDFLNSRGWNLPEPSKPADSDNQPNKKTETAKPETESNEKETT